MKILLVEPDFPYAPKSLNRANSIHKNFVPIGLLKLGAYYKNELKCQVKLVRGLKTRKDLFHFLPDKILITSLFTYWSEYVWQSATHYRELFPQANIILGGIYVTLHHHRADFQKKIEKLSLDFHVGLHEKAEGFLPDYSLLSEEVEYHATHATRGCIRKCKFCGTWQLEPKRSEKPVPLLVEEIKRIGKRKVIFFDNNLLSHSEIEFLLESLSEIKINGRPISYESQSGFDGRLLLKKPWLATLIKKARFQNIRIAWDNSLSDAKKIEEQIKLLNKAGYPSKDISVFMIYNYDIPYEEMLKKIECCRIWGVQIADCRYRPLDVTYDHYNPAKGNVGQTNKEYYIHEQADWTDQKIRTFRKLVRQHNIWVRYAKDRGQQYDPLMEKWSRIKNLYKFFKLPNPPKMELIQISPKIQLEISQLFEVKKICLKKNILPPDLSEMKMAQKKRFFCKLLSLVKR